MAGLIRDIASTYKSFNSLNKVKTFGSDLLNNVSKSVGLKDSAYNLDSKFSGSDAGITAQGKDIRGLKQVFRDKIYQFRYNTDFKCFQDDFYFNTDGKDFKNNIQQVKIYEFQPFHQAQLGAVISQLKNKLSSKDAIESAAKTIASEWGGALAPKVLKNYYIEQISKNPQKFYENQHINGNKTDISININDSSGISYDNNHHVTGVDVSKSNFSQLSQINNMFRFGHWLNVYILPCLDKTIYEKMFYLNENYSTWGTTKESQKGFGAQAADIAKMILSPLTSMEGGFIKTPYWQPQQGVMNDSFTLKLTLINDDSLSILNGWTFKNYKFMQNIITGTMPTAMVNGVMQYPNIYKVYIPGKMYYYWASMKVNATALGKQRRIPQLSKKLIKEYNIKSIDENTLWPEAWQLNFTITNLLPMSFTTYVDYLMTSQDQIMSQERKKSRQKNAKDANQGVILMIDSAGQKHAEMKNGFQPKK